MAEQVLTIPLQDTINAQFREFAQQTKEYIDAIRRDYSLGDTPAMGELEFNVPIKSVQEGANKLQDHCTKYVDDFTEIMDTPLIVDEWQAVEEVRYKKLLDYNFNQFSSNERKTYIYALTDCHNLKRLIFDSLRTITLTEGTSQFAYGNLIRLEEVSIPAITNISSSSGGGSNSSQILSGLSALTALSLPAITNISSSSGSGNSSQILSGLSALTALSLPAITNISSSSGGGINSSQILSGLSALTALSLPAITNISSSSRGSINSSQILSGLSALTALSLPAITNISSSSIGNGNSSQILSGLSALTALSLPAITNISSSGSGGNSSQILSGCVNLEYIEIGHTDANGYGSITGNMRCDINPTNTYNDSEKLSALNASIREHWFTNLRDYTGGTAHTLTLMSAFVQHLEAETIQVATDKNWTIVTF